MPFAARRSTSLRFCIFGIVVATCIAAAACSASWRVQLSRGERYEQQNRPAAALAVYDALWQLSRAAEAFTAFQKSVDADPENLRARLRLAELFLAGGGADGAREHAAFVLQREPKNADALTLLGSAEAASGHVERAQQLLSRALEVDPKRVRAALVLAELYNRQENVEAARAVLLRAGAADPASALPWLSLGRLEEQEGDVVAAEQAYRKARAVEDNATTNLRLAQFLERGARVNEAEEILQRLDRAAQQSSALPDFELISGHAERAWPEYVSMLRARPKPGSDAQARAATVARLIEADIATSEPASSGAGGLNGSQGTTAAVSRARMHLDQFRHQLDAGSTALLEAEIALARGDVAMAQFHAAAATVVAPDSAAARYLLGVARYRAGEPALARKEWMAALEADSDYIPAQLAMGERALAEGDAAEAEEQAAAVVREEPANLQALLLYARALAVGKQRDAAAAVAGRAAMLDAFAPEPHLILGSLAVEQYRLGAALLEFEQAVLLGPHAADAVEGMMQVYRRGRVDRAALLGMEAAAEREPRSATLLEITGRLFAEHGWTSETWIARPS